MSVLLVEDDQEALKQYIRDFPEVFSSRGIKADIDSCDSFDDAFVRISSPLYRYDLVISDTYKGPPRNGNAEVLGMVNRYRGSRFCPLVIYSSGVKPPTLQEGAFLVWADKSKSGDIERAMNQILDTHVPQLARQLHEDLEQSTGSYLWTFLEQKWPQLNASSPLGPSVLERIVRRRAAIQIGNVNPSSGTAAVATRHASEYYVYPAFEKPHYNLGNVLCSRNDNTDWRVILTPHCHLRQQSNQAEPRSDHVLLVKAIKAEIVLGNNFDNAKAKEGPKKQKILGRWAQSPARIEGQPEGRHWYLPGFLDIPHSFCDFQQVESVSYTEVKADFDVIATLISPYAEAMQSCFVGFYASVGLDEINTESIRSLLA